MEPNLTVLGTYTTPEKINSLVTHYFQFDNARGVFIFFLPVFPLFVPVEEEPESRGYTCEFLKIVASLTHVKRSHVSPAMHMRPEKIASKSRKS